MARRGLWFVATIGLFVGSILAGGTRSVDAVSRDQQAQYESSEAYLVYGDANAAAGQETPTTQQFLLLVSTPNCTVDDPAFQAALDDIVGRLRASSRPSRASTVRSSSSSSTPGPRLRRRT